MVNRLCLLIVLSSALINIAVAYNKHISYKTLLECKEYQLDRPNFTSYRDFFELVKFQNNKFSEREHFRIKLYILAAKDAKILLKSSGNSGYEIALGIKNNTVSQISDQKKVYVRDNYEADDAYALSPFFPTEIVLKYNGSKLMVIYPGAPTRKYMQVSDSSYFPRTISFRTSKENTIRVFYDCPMGADALHDDEITDFPFPETV